MRPRSLAEVARLVAAGESFDLCLANFLDQFYLGPRRRRYPTRRFCSSLPAANWGACRTPIWRRRRRSWRGVMD